LPRNDSSQGPAGDGGAFRALWGRKRVSQQILTDGSHPPNQDADQGWIAKHLRIRSGANFSQQIRRFKKISTGSSILELNAGYNLSRIVD
jgi:hypothetical protein